MDLCPHFLNTSGMSRDMFTTLFQGRRAEYIDSDDQHRDDLHTLEVAQTMKRELPPQPSDFLSVKRPRTDSLSSSTTAISIKQEEDDAPQQALKKAQTQRRREKKSIAPRRRDSSVTSSSASSSVPSPTGTGHSQATSRNQNEPSSATVGTPSFTTTLARPTVPPPLPAALRRNNISANTFVESYSEYRVKSPEKVMRISIPHAVRINSDKTLRANSDLM